MTQMDAAIKRILISLEQRGVQLKDMVALDFFAREGDWQSHQIAERVAKVHAWEIDPRFESNLKKNLPVDATVVIGDSFDILKNSAEIFDLIVLDNPQGCFGKGYCEHFEALPAILERLPTTGVVIFNVKTKPFNYDDKLEWQARRNSFYGVDSRSLDEKFVFDFYEKYFNTRGFDVDFSFWEVRPQETGLYEYAAKLTRKS